MLSPPVVSTNTWDKPKHGHGVGRRLAVLRLGHPVAIAIVGIYHRGRHILHAHQPVGIVVRIAKDAIVQQIAVVVPIIPYIAHLCQAVGVIVGVGDYLTVGAHRQAVAHLVVGVGVHLATE